MGILTSSKESIQGDFMPNLQLPRLEALKYWHVIPAGALLFSSRTTLFFFYGKLASKPPPLRTIFSGTLLTISINEKYCCNLFSKILLITIPCSLALCITQYHRQTSKQTKHIIREWFQLLYISGSDDVTFYDFIYGIIASWLFWNIEKQ